MDRNPSLTSARGGNLLGRPCATFQRMEIGLKKTGGNGMSEQRFKKGDIVFCGGGADYPSCFGEIANVAEVFDGRRAAGE